MQVFMLRTCLVICSKYLNKVLLHILSQIALSRNFIPKPITTVNEIVIEYRHLLVIPSRRLHDTK